METKLTDGLGKDVPYDLRQVYAVEILGEHLKDVARARKKDDYSSYFKCLKDLWIIVKHKIKKSDKEKATEEYKELMNGAVKVANQYPQEFTGRGKDPNGCALIEEVLNEVETFLYDKIEEANLFGTQKKIPGL